MAACLAMASAAPQTLVHTTSPLIRTLAPAGFATHSVAHTAHAPVVQQVRTLASPVLTHAAAPVVQQVRTVAQAPVLTIVHCLLHYIDMAQATQTINADLLRTVARFVEVGFRTFCNETEAFL